MVTTYVGVGVLVGLVLGAGVVGYLIGRRAGRRAERRRWQQHVAGEARELDRTRALIRRALEKKADQ
jgi:hypothetical protein